MGIQADNMAEVVTRSRNDMAGSMTDLRNAKIIELLTAPGGAVWINVDGVCALRIQHVDTVFVDTSNALSTDKVIP